MTLTVRARLAHPDFVLDVDSALPTRGVTAIFGPSGCGKTSLLRLIAGLHRCPGAHISLGDQVWQSGRRFVPLEKRRIGLVFQEASLLPHLSVQDNLLYGYQRTPAELRRLEPADAIQQLSLAPLLDRRIDQLSGGQRQRIALGRALLSSPQLLLLDEPLSALDTAAKREILPYLERLARDFDVPVIYVSHAAREIERLADHVAFMQDGRVQSVVSLEQALSRPDSPLFADEGAVTVLRGELQPGNQDNPPTFRSGSLTLRLTEATGAASSSRLLIRARDVSLALDPPERMSILNRLPMSVRAIHPARNGHVIVEGQLTNGPILLAEISAWSCRELGLASGTPAYALVKAVSLLD